MHIEVNRDLEKFKDINYITSNHEEREDIIEEYCKLLNTFDDRISKDCELYDLYNTNIHEKIRKNQIGGFTQNPGI